MLAAILTCGLVMTSCDDVLDVIDNPTTTETEQASAKDPGKWWIDENNMDKSVNPGDNFFMYCNGTWWKNTTLSAAQYFINRFTNVKPTFQDRVSSLTDANYQTFLSHLKWADDGSEAAIAGQKLYDDVLAKSGLNEAKTNEDLMRALGRMAAMGVCPGIWLEPFFMDGKVCLYARYHMAEIFTTANEADLKEYDAQMRPTLQQMMEDDPALQSHLVPLAGRGGTRALPEQCVAAKYIVEGMGFDPNDVYIIDECYKKKLDKADPEIETQARQTKNQIDACFPMAKSLNDLKKDVLDYYDLDYGFISLKTRDAYNERKNKRNSSPFRNEVKVSLSKLRKDIENLYIHYMRAKLVADQMVPKGLKEEYQRHCEEIRSVFAQRIKDSDWLSDASKKNALEKLDAMVINVGYPDKWISEALPDFSKSKSLIEDIYSFRKARIDLLKAIVGKSRQERWCHIRTSTPTARPSARSMCRIPARTSSSRRRSSIRTATTRKEASGPRLPTRLSSTVGPDCS